jgi:TRAP-type C4-dicarboxylate transport system permease large subunit
VREVIPYLTVLILVLLALVLFPELTLWLPRQFGYEG